MTVSCVLNNSPYPFITPKWINSNGTVVSESPFLTLGARLIPITTEFFCVVMFFNTMVLETGFNYTVLIPAVVISQCSLNNTIDGLVSVDCSNQLAIIATAIDSPTLSANLLITLDNILRLTNGNTLTEDSIVNIATNTLAIVRSALSVSTDETTENAVIGIFDELTDLFGRLSNAINEIFIIQREGFMIQSQVIQNTSSDVSLSLNVLNSSETVTLNISQNIIGSNTRVTFIFSDIALGRSVTIGVSVGGVIRSSVVSIGIQGVGRNSALNPPISLEFPFPATIDTTTSDPLCVFWNEDTQLWNTEGVETVVLSGRVVCPASHLTSFAVLEVERKTQNIALRIIAYVLLALSLIALCISLILFILSGARFFDVEMNRMYFNYALALLIAIATFIFGVNLGVLNNVLCIIVSVLVHYFWLAVFSWGLAIAILVTYMVTIGLMKRISLFWPLFALAWILPLPIVIITFIIGMVRGDYARRDEQCFLTLEYIWSLIGPILVIIVLSTIGYVIAIVRMIMISMKRVGGENKLNSSMLKRALIAGVILLPVLGLPWIVILIDFIFAQYAITSVVFEWVFLILNGPSGIIFLIVFTLMNRAVQQTLRGKICGKDELVAMTTTTVEGKVITNLRSKEIRQPQTGFELENIYAEPRDIIYSNKSVEGGEVVDIEEVKDQEATGEVFPESTGVSDEQKETTMI